MQKFLVILLFVIVLPVSAQVGAASEEVTLPLPYRGFQFHFSPSFGFFGLENAEFNYTWPGKNLMNSYRLGLSLDVSVEYNVSEDNDKRTDYESSYERGRKDTTTSLSNTTDLSIYCDRIHRFLDKPLTPYWGIGLKIGSSLDPLQSWSNSEYTPENNSDEYDRLDLDWSILGSIRGILGIEWRIMPQMSLSLEYRLSLTYKIVCLSGSSQSIDKDENGFATFADESDDSSIQHLFSLNTTTIDLGVTFYF